MRCKRFENSCKRGLKLANFFEKGAEKSKIPGKRGVDLAKLLEKGDKKCKPLGKGR